MPYDPSHPPAKLKKLSKKKQRQWVKTFNAAYSRYGDDAKAHKIAWGAVKKSFEDVAYIAFVKR
jgi:cation transport regulator ChaB